MSIVFFILFGLVILMMYLSVRRQMFPLGATAFIGVIASVICMTLFSLAQGNVMLQALAVGMVIGGVFSIVTLALALYFQGNERREELMRGE